MNINFSTIPDKAPGKRTSRRRRWAMAYGVVSRIGERCREAVTAMRVAARAIAADALDLRGESGEQAETGAGRNKLRSIR
jgi:hypothetical protein